MIPIQKIPKNRKIAIDTNDIKDDNKERLHDFFLVRLEKYTID